MLETRCDVISEGSHRRPDRDGLQKKTKKSGNQVRANWREEWGIQGSAHDDDEDGEHSRGDGSASARVPTQDLSWLYEASYDEGFRLATRVPLADRGDAPKPRDKPSRIWRRRAKEKKKCGRPRRERGKKKTKMPTEGWKRRETAGRPRKMDAATSLHMRPPGHGREHIFYHPVTYFDEPALTAIYHPFNRGAAGDENAETKPPAHPKKTAQPRPRETFRSEKAVKKQFPRTFLW